ncbi:MAG: flagellar biosynthesis protein FlhB [Proteobacteria bacterium]|nr:flagellar biosynthesis protein FlhB [Pseudomonadota bacterium]
MASPDEPGPRDRGKLAAALTYDRGKDEAPRLAAKGKGLIAEQIIALAQKNGITVREDADLVQVLMKLELDMPIPLEAYAAVAEILAYVYKANAKAGNRT